MNSESAQPERMTTRWWRRLRTVVRNMAVVAAASWCLLACYFYLPLPPWGRWLATAVCGIWWLFLWRGRFSSWFRWSGFLLTFALIVVAWCFVRPSDQGDWSRLHANVVEAEFDGDQVQLRNVRSTEYNPDGTYDVFYLDRELDLNRVSSVWFGVQQFVSWRGGSHTFVSFGFDDGEYLTISVEARRGEGQQFNPLHGMFKQCGLIYVVGSELDIIGSRAAESEYPIYLYPIRATREQSREMLVTMLRRADGLGDRPEFYHTTVNNCTTNIVDSFNQIAPIRISGFSPRVMFPGYSGGVAYEQGLIASDLPFEEVQKNARINELAREASAGNFSQRIRSNFTK